MSNDKEAKDGKVAAPATATPAAAPVTAAAVSAAASVAPEDRLGMLLELLLGRESTALEKEAVEKKHRQARAAAAEATEKQNLYNLLKLQAKCTHMKGKGKRTSRLEAQYADKLNDPNVSMHTFIDGTSVIKCLSCGAKWKQNDTREYLVREGKKIPNVTRLGWEDALHLVQISTNQPSSSEIPGAVLREVKPPTDMVIPENFQL
jgi:hypothetical protein